MKKFLSVLLTLCMLTMAFPFSAIAAEAPTFNAYGCQTVSIRTLGAFEESHKGYVSTIEKYDGRFVRSIKRDGSDDTSTKFNLYHWSSPLPDVNGDPIPLSTTNYIIIDYYYHSPDAEPALVGNKMSWMQGRVASMANHSSFVEFNWKDVTVSRNGMIANKWDKLVLPFGTDLETSKNLLLRNKDYYLHQLKLYPLEKDMGKNDVLYIGDITIQSWDPAGESGIAERNVNFYASKKAFNNGDAPVFTMKAKDLDTITLPEYTFAKPENTKFKTWKNADNGDLFKSGDTYQLLLGKDMNFIAEFDYSFDFTAYEKAYINGYEDGTFKPQNNVTRAEACKMIASIVNPNENAMGETSFADVKPTDWFYNSVTTLEALGALDIWQENFEPSKEIKRAELVQIVYAISDKETNSMKLIYLSDVNEKASYFEAIMFAVANGIVTGYEDQTFKPNNKITRAETVTVINRMLGRTWNEQGTTKFSDIDAHWAKGQIIASSTSKADGVWTIIETEKEYLLEGTSAKDYITGLHTQAKNLSGDAIRRGIDTVSEQMKKDILSTPNTAEIYPDRIGKNTYYISEKNGDDNNSGKSPDDPVKTIAGLYSKLRFPGKGTAFLFERGGTYRGQINAMTGITIGSYGEGAKPVLSGSLKNYALPSLWQETDAPNVYKLAENITNVGVITFDHADDAVGNYDDLYGKIRVYEKHIIEYVELEEDLQFYSCGNILYLCSTEGNPGARFKDIEIGTRKDIIDGSASDFVVDNLHLKHTGAHGVGLGSGDNVTVTNCLFSWLGGSLLGSYGETQTQYGNAVEMYGNCDGFYVKNNWMWQIYDTAITHQGSNLTMKNIYYADNLMEYCHWGIESWMTQPDTEGSLDGYLAEYNVLRNGGYGWGTIVNNRQGNSMLYTFYNYTVKNTNLKNHYNIIDRGAGYLVNDDFEVKEVFSNDIYVQHKGMILGGLRGTDANADLDAPILIHKKLEDKDPVVVLISEGTE